MSVTAIRNQDSLSFDDAFAGISDEQVIDRAMQILEDKHKPGSEVLRSPELTGKYLRMKLADLKYEVFGVLMLDNRHRVLEVTELFRGTIDGCAVYPREVVKAALQCNAAAMILYHNHPSGINEPSQADISLTKRLKEALGMVDIRVLDHMIVSGAEPHVSLAERGLL